MPREGFQLLPTSDDAARALGSFHRALAPGGRLMLDCANFSRSVDPATYAMMPEYFDPTTASGEVVFEWRRPTPDGNMLSRSRSQRIQDGEGVATTFHYTLDGADAARDTWSSDLFMRSIDFEALIAAVGSAGLSVDAVYSDYEGGGFLRRGARMILLATKQ